MQKQFTFILNPNDKAYKVALTMELRTQQHKAKRWDNLEEVEGLPVLSICGDIYEKPHDREPLACGQIIEDLEGLRDYVKAEDLATFDLIIYLWKAYHLNDMNGGTQKQEALLSAEGIKGNNYDYDKAKKTLEAFGLLTDRGYTYGTGWLYRPIRAEALAKIEELLKD